MSVRIPKKMDVILTPYVPTLKDRTSAAAFEATKEMVRIAQVKLTVVCLKVKARLRKKIEAYSTTTFVPNENGKTLFHGL